MQMTLKNIYNNKTEYVDIVFRTPIDQVSGTRVFNNGLVKPSEDRARGGRPGGREPSIPKLVRILG